MSLLPFFLVAPSVGGISDMTFLITCLVGEKVIYKSPPGHTCACGAYFPFCWMSQVLGQTNSFKLPLNEFMFYSSVVKGVMQVSNSGASAAECLICIGAQQSLLG